MKAVWSPRILFGALLLFSFILVIAVFLFILPGPTALPRTLLAGVAVSCAVVTCLIAIAVWLGFNHHEFILKSFSIATDTTTYLLDSAMRYSPMSSNFSGPLFLPTPPMPGMTFSQMYGSDFAAPFETVFAQVLADGRKRVVHYPLVLGKYQHFFEARIRLIKAPNWKKPLILIVIHDISRPTRFARMQAHNIRWFRTIFNKLSEAVVLSDSTGRIRGVNHRTMELYGLKKWELLDRTMDVLFSNFDHEVAKTLVPDAENPVRVSEHLHKHRDGSIFPVEIRSSPVRIENENFSVSLIRDITFQKELEEQQIRYENNLLNQNAMRDKLFSILAHDLRGPIGNLRNFLALYQHDRTSFTPTEFEEFLEGLWKSSDAVWELLENLLSWVRNQFSELSINEVPVGLLDTCRTVSGWLLPQAQTKHQEIRVGSIVDHVLLTDPHMLQTVIRNLLGNAIKFTPIGGGIAMRVVTGEAEVGIVVEDTGPGIPAHRLRELFALRGGQSTPGTAGEKGSGLGLVLCDEITRRLGGRIQVDSSSQGTVFTVWLPANVEGELDPVEEAGEMAT